MLRYVLKRLAYAAILLLAVLTLNFLLIHVSPGDPVETLAGSMGGMTEELREQLRRQFGLDRPFIVQLGIYLGKVLQGDLGQSYYFNASVASLIWERVPATLLLVVVSVLLAFFVGTLLGALAARRPNGLLSQSVTILSIVGYSAPVFWTGIVLIILFASVWPIFPVSDMRTAGADSQGWAGMLDVLEHLVLPAFTLAFVYLAQYSRLARASMMETLSSDYIRTARAKGLSEGVVLYKHALRNAVLPVVTMLGMQFGNVLAGAILVETVFNWPGLGRLAFDSVLRRDYPTLLGILFFASLMVVVMNQLTDVAYRIIDPRIKTS
ncbi:ABC transporter permease [Parapusillimonas granuli]|uniref:ABC transporter permease n=1 Tax=Parapusillimonas granuli TaxID=380911 RepID=A0A853G354_9BURK|nr:ABC transporter permease [Parapusillimonas granuli]MBB5215963.1 peptide/nickel transport system permease protein [Parapusillimonas granuli]MEB2399354.1 ABC transporter permease [Alcaligenaceae bacterium]NYT50739.1 ABC transporter permease [Parapusillimonas granuli]